MIRRLAQLFVAAMARWAGQVGTELVLTAQSTNVSATTLFTPLASGLYRASAYIQVTQAATTSSTMPSIALAFTDPDASASQTINMTSTSSGNTTSTLAQAVAVFKAKTGTTIQLSTSGYASTGGTAMNFALIGAVEAM